MLHRFELELFFLLTRGDPLQTFLRGNGALDSFSEHVTQLLAFRFQCQNCSLMLYDSRYDINETTCDSIPETLVVKLKSGCCKFRRWSTLRQKIPSPSQENRRPVLQSQMHRRRRFFRRSRSQLFQLITFVFGAKCNAIPPRLFQISFRLSMERLRLEGFHCRRVNSILD